MKKAIIVILACSISMMCIACQKSPDALSIPAFPLEAFLIEAALEDVNLDWTVKQEIESREHVTTFTLYDAENKMIALLTSTKKSEARGLQLSFISSEHVESKIRTPLPQEDWEKVISLSTSLYGGFDDKKIIEESRQFLQEEISNFNFASGTINLPTWERDISGIHYIMQLRVSPNAKQTDFYTIRIYNDETLSFPSKSS